MPVELFGLSIGRAKKEALANQTPVEPKATSFVLPELDDAVPIDAGGLYGIGYDLDGSFVAKVNLLQNIEKSPCTQRWSRRLKIFVMKRLSTDQKNIQWTQLRFF